MTSDNAIQRQEDLQARRIREQRDYEAFLLVLKALMDGFGSDEESSQPL